MRRIDLLVTPLGRRIILIERGGGGVTSTLMVGDRRYSAIPRAIIQMWAPRMRKIYVSLDENIVAYHF